MPAPTFTALNGQIKTPWRWYDGQHKLTQYQPQCRAELDGCIRNAVLSSQSSLPPFQFPRPSSVSSITSWKLYDVNGVELVDLAAEIPLIEVQAFSTFDYVIYPGTILGTPLDAGVYYARMVTGGVTYYAEPIQVACDIEEADCFYTDWKQDEFQSADNPSSYWLPGGAFAKFFDHIHPIAGAPTNPAWEIPGTNVANTADELLYTWDGASWNSSTPSDGWWFYYGFGFWWQYTGGAWVGGSGAPNQVYANYGLQFYATAEPVPLGINLSDLGDDCACFDTSPLRIEITVADSTAGTLTVSVDGDTPEVLSGNDTFGFTSYIANGYVLTFTPSADFDGGVTAIRFLCLGSASACFRRLTWTNCGNVGNTYYEAGFVQELWLRSDVVPVFPTPSTRIESEEQADGSVVETFRRKEVRYQLRLGIVPWHIAEAVKEIELMDTVRLYHLEGDGYDTLTDVKVEVNWDEELSECMPDVRVTFLLEAAAVACCDEFDRPCLVICVDAHGFVSDVGPGSTGNYLDDDVVRYIEYTEGVDGERIECESGAANIIQDEVEAITHGQDVQTYVWNIQLETWVLLAVIDEVTSTTVGSDCEVLVQATIMDGYSGIIQFWDGFVWTDSDFGTLTSEEWPVNTEAWIKQTGAQFIRIRVVVGNCESGFSAAWPTNVSCS